MKVGEVEVLIVLNHLSRKVRKGSAVSKKEKISQWHAWHSRPFVQD